MQTKEFISTVLILILAFLGWAFLPIRAEATTSSPQGQAQSIDPQISYPRILEHNKAVHAARSRTRLQLALNGGMEQDSAGLHLTFRRVEEDPDVRSVRFPAHGDHCVRRWCFWGCSAYDFDYPDDMLTGRQPRNYSAYDRLLPNTPFTFTISSSGGGGHSILLTADSNGMESLRYLTSPLSVNSSDGSRVDWYGIKRQYGEADTPLHFSLISNDTSYNVINLHTALEAYDAAGAPSYTLTLANDLSSQEAQAIVSRL